MTQPKLADWFPSQTRERHETIPEFAKPFDQIAIGACGIETFGFCIGIEIFCRDSIRAPVM